MGHIYCYCLHNVKILKCSWFNLLIQPSPLPFYPILLVTLESSQSADLILVLWIENIIGRVQFSVWWTFHWGFTTYQCFFHTTAIFYVFGTRASSLVTLIAGAQAWVLNHLTSYSSTYSFIVKSKIMVSFTQC
jgi:hypothetical protein